MLNHRLDQGVIDKLRLAGRIAAAARALGAAQMVPGALRREVCDAVEAEIERLGGQPAFPAQTSVNHVAAHDCPSPDDPRRYALGDLAKLDLGVHVDGWVVDTAITVEVGGRDGAHPLVAAARAALEAAIQIAGAGVPVRRLSAAIEASIRAAGFRPMRNLCGHGVGRYTVHCPPPIPNEPDEGDDTLSVGQTIAIEPFATDGPGVVAELNRAEVFRVEPAALDTIADRSLGGLLDQLRQLRGLPFSRRQLTRHGERAIEAVFDRLRAGGTLHSYPPLAEASRRPVAQAEHTLLIHAEGAEVLTR